MPARPRITRPRALLTLLLLDAGRTVSVERLTDGLYGAEPPAGAANALQSQISRLRRRLGPRTGIEATSAGYRIATPPETVDAHLSERLSRDGRTALAAGDHPQAEARLREALALWRGPALPALRDAYAEVARLDELRLAAVQDRIEADLALGGGLELLPEVRSLLSYDRQDVAAQQRILAERFAGMGGAARPQGAGDGGRPVLRRDRPDPRRPAHRGPGGVARGRGVRRHDGRHGDRCGDRRGVRPGR